MGIPNVYMCAIFMHTHNNAHTWKPPDYSRRTKRACPCRTESYYLKDLFKQADGSWWRDEWKGRAGGRWGERDFLNAITLLMAGRILTGPWGSLKGICKCNPNERCRWRDVFSSEPAFALPPSFGAPNVELSMMHITVRDGWRGVMSHFKITL